MQNISASASVAGMAHTDSIQRRCFTVGGQVQGVGFRPFVYRIALEHHLGGCVGNTSDGVRVEVQGTADALDAFYHDLLHRLPPLARITSCVVEELPVVAPVSSVSGQDVFRIVPSQGHSGHSVLISPDVALCEDCRRDMADPHNRRYRYPFTNCTNCGPRYTITHAIPYDRAVTSMSCFPLCPQCQAEYDNPLDRRFHAQPNACPVCGPQVWIYERGGETPDIKGVERGAEKGVEKGVEALRYAAQCLRKGHIAAIKGLGGFHLTCDATNASVVALLRERKTRPHKPLAVMVPDVASARRLAHVGAAEEALLCSVQRPIVLCRKRAGTLPDGIAPDVENVGLVLPYTPLHQVLFEVYAEMLPAGMPAALVMTSGNAGGEPICLGNREAIRRLLRIADVFLLHNRDILVRNDDSVAGFVPVLPDMPPAPPIESPIELNVEPHGAPHGGPEADAVTAAPLFYRRARGYVPEPVPLGAAGPCVLGAGPELKATLCLTRGDAAFVSQHVGDLQNLDTLGFYEEVAAHLEMVLETRPEAVVHDLHPDFLSTAFARELAARRGLPCLALQHHFAHAWAVLAEHGYAAGGKGAALALVLDGTGLGEDGTIWGGEVLWVDTDSGEQRRLGRLRPFALPGGEAAIREPWRIALGLGGEADVPPLQAAASESSVAAVREMLRRGVNCPLTSSAGRLFDAVAAGLGLCCRTTYEGQAALRLEAAQQNLPWTREHRTARGVPVIVEERSGLWELDSHALFAATVEKAHCESVPLAARAFHVGLAQGLADMVARAAVATDTRTVALGGGAMQNATLAALLPWLLRERGLRPLLPRRMPANDGAVSLGQAAWGRAKLLRG